MSPEAMTSLGLKTDYDKLDDYTDAQNREYRDLAERQLTGMKARFDYEKLSHAGQISYRLLENDVERGRARLTWRWHDFPILTHGRPAGDIPVYLLHQHRIAKDPTGEDPRR